ncbi:putative membrane protein [Sphingomonas vulcanisoli]|uniref:Membrane protein n=1 Tax=Sphingomonas vulcanisoli TaxID=1658060 RepID=A0ABX0TTZ1_9SPHN|nr:putative membrane protein [Sphingomonas vulcanisoli]
MSRLNWATAVATFGGLGLAIWMLGRTGLAQTFGVLSNIGFGGFTLFILSYLTVLLALGAAWSTARRRPHDHFPVFVWARAVREAANDLLPFSQIGGLVLGLRTLTVAGVPPVQAYAATIIDLTTEIASQLLLVLIGVGVAIHFVVEARAYADLRITIWVGVALLGLLTASVLFLRTPMLRFATKMADRLVPAASAVIDDVRGELARFEANRFAIVPSFFWNLIAWLLSVFCVWLALRLLGHPIDPLRALALEALISVIRSSAFLIPGAIGAQEAGYVVLAGVFGMDPQAALALSLLKRARDFTIGVPSLLIWQFGLFGSAERRAQRL